MGRLVHNLAAPGDPDLQFEILQAAQERFLRCGLHAMLGVLRTHAGEL